jgi:hypothetical protein
MGRRQEQKKSLYDKGLVADVNSALSGLYDIEVKFGNWKYYAGKSKIKFPGQIPLRSLPIHVCDAHNGEITITVLSRTPTSIARIVRKRLKTAGINVHTINNCRNGEAQHD